MREDPDNFGGPKRRPNLPDPMAGCRSPIFAYLS